MEKTQKVWFLQVIRFLACTLIVYIHWYGISTSPNNIHNMILQEAIPNYPTLALKEYITLFAYKLGLSSLTVIYFGLGLFFILSGFVIPLSLKNSTPLSYLIRRVFRIYPVLIVTMLIAVVTLTLAAYFLGSPAFKNLLHLKLILTNIFLVRDITYWPFIDNAIWTLEIEIHFYLLVFAFFYFGIEKKLRTYIVSALVMLILSHIFPYLNQTRHVPVFFLRLSLFMSLNSGYLTLMFVGSVIYYTASKQWSVIKGITGTIILLSLNKLCLDSGFYPTVIASTIFTNHLYVLAAFLSLYYSNDYLPYSHFINKMAEISYPLYLLHGFTGYAFYFVFYHLTENIIISCLLSLSCVFLLTFIVHYKIERPSIELSKDLIKGRLGNSKLADFILKRKLVLQRYLAD